MADDNPHYRRASCEFPLFFLALAKIRVIINNYQFGGFPTCAATKPIKRFIEKSRIHTIIFGGRENTILLVS